MRDYRQRTVIIAMIAVWMVQVSIDQIIDVITMRNRRMPTARPVPMRRVVSAAAVLRRAAVGILRSNLYHVFIDPAVMRMMEMPSVKIIDVIVMSDCDMSATRTVNMRLIGGGHDFSFPVPEFG